MPIHPRSVWEDPRNPVTGPPPVGGEHTLVMHWPGSSSVPTSFTATCDALRAMDRDYRQNRGYSLGYSWAISRDGHAIEVRGDDYRNAANKGDKVQGNANTWSRSILLFCGVNTQKSVTQAQIAAVHELIRARGYASFDQQVHLDVDYTQCAGSDITVAVRSGTFRTSPQPPEEDDVAYQARVKIANKGFWFAQWNNGTKTWIPDPETLAVHKALWPNVPETEYRADQKDWMRAAGPIVGPIPPGVDGWGT